MLEKECIQSRGFKNVKKDGEIVGFQFKIRSLYYRGLWLSQLRPATVWVDGEEFSGDQITWTIKGFTYTQEEMAEIGDVHWGLLDLATLTVKKEGGLSEGIHEIKLDYSYSSSYMPPSMDEMLSGGPYTRKITLIGSIEK